MAAVPLYHVGESVSVLMCVCAPDLHQVMEGCTVEENSGEIELASLAHVRKYMILCNILSNSKHRFVSNYRSLFHLCLWV